MLLIVFVPVTYYLVRNKPEDVGLLPDRAAASRDDTEGTPVIQEQSWTLTEAARSRAFWLVLICMAIPAAIYTGITFQLFSIMDEQGVDRSTTAFILSLVPMVSFVCSLASGFISEKVKVHAMLGITFLLNMIAPMLLLYAEGGVMVFWFAIAWGAAQGFMNIPLGIIWPNYYGRQHLGSIQSVTTAATVVGSALGPVAFGAVYDQTGSYSIILIASMVIWAAGALMAFLSPQPVKK
ncbi:MFS transporter [Marinicrinis lubricantis]